MQRREAKKRPSMARPAREERRDRWERMKLISLKNRQEVLRLWLVGFEVPDIAQMCGCSRLAAQNRLAVALQEVRRLVCRTARELRIQGVKPGHPWLRFARAIELQLHLHEVLEG